MATYYSSLYSAIPNRGYAAGVETVTTSYVYKGPSIQRYNEPITIYGTYTQTASPTFAAASSDQLILCPALTGIKLLSYRFLQSADLDTDNDFTFNLGFTGALTGFLSASTGLQATTGVAAEATTLMTIAGATTDGSLILSAQAGELEAAGTLHFLLQLVRPQ